MKKLKIVWMLPVAIVFLSALLSSNLRIADSKNEGIKFHEGSWKEALQKSKNAHKPIFLDIYATWCGPCRLLKRNTFSDKEVGDYFNSHYINVSVDGEDEEGSELMERYGLHSYPSLLVINQDEKPVVVSAGYRSPKQLIEFGKNSLEKINQ